MPDPIVMLHPIDDAQLSAYYDDALDDGEQRVVAAHLQGCARCRDRLAAYAEISAALRAEGDPVPPSRLDVRIETLLLRETRPFALFRPVPRLLARTSFTAVAAAALIIGALVFGQTFGTGPDAPAVAQAYPCDNAAECAVAVRFDLPVDRTAVERSVRVDPPVPVALTWHGDTLLVKPTEALQPEHQYTVSVGVAPTAGAGSRKAPVETVAVRIVAPRAPGSPVVVAPSRSIPPTRTATATSPASPTRPASTPTAEHDASPTAVPPAATRVPVVVAPTRSPAATTTPTSVPPLSTATPTVACLAVPSTEPGPEVLGCVLVARVNVSMVSQPFEHGRLIWRSDRRRILALFANGTWAEYPAAAASGETTPVGVGARLIPGAAGPGPTFARLILGDAKLRAILGAPIGPEAPVAGAVENRQQGELIWSDLRAIVALSNGGTWAMLADRAPTPTTTPTASPSPTIWPTATASPTAGTPTPTASPSTSATALPTTVPDAGGPASPTTTPTSTATPTGVGSPSATPPVVAASVTPVPVPASSTPGSTPSGTTVPSATPTTCGTTPIRALAGPTSTVSPTPGRCTATPSSGG